MPGLIVYITNLYWLPTLIQVWRDVYFIIITILTVSTIVIQLHQKFFSHGWFRYRILIYVFLVGYGVLPTIHWIYLNGGPQAEIVQVCKLSLSFNSIFHWHVLSLKDDSNHEKVGNRQGTHHEQSSKTNYYLGSIIRKLIELIFIGEIIFREKTRNFRYNCETFMNKRETFTN